jgi:hypothetical protein
MWSSAIEGTSHLRYAVRSRRVSSHHVQQLVADTHHGTADRPTTNYPKHRLLSQCANATAYRPELR